METEIENEIATKEKLEAFKTLQNLGEQFFCQLDKLSKDELHKMNLLTCASTKRCVRIRKKTTGYTLYLVSEQSMNKRMEKLMEKRMERMEKLETKIKN